MDVKYNTGFYTDYYEENFADKESNESTIENVKDAQSGEDLELEDK